MIAGLDIGTTKIACFVARRDADGTIRITGIGQESADGMRAGGVVDMDAAERAIRTAVHREPGAVGQALVVRPDDEADDAPQHEHHAGRGDHENHGRALAAPVEAEDETIRGQARGDRGQNPEGQRQQRGRQRRDADAHPLEPPRREQNEHGAERHQVAVGEIGETQNAEDQGDAEGTQGEL